MAINVNKVYKSVLSILNKEQRGYLTPYEFNNLARQAQLGLLDSLFYQYNQFLNIENINRTNEGYADLAEKIQEQIDEFYTSSDLTISTGEATIPSDVYRILDITTSSQQTKIEKIDKARLPFLKSSPLTKPTTTFPIYYQTASKVIIDPSTISSASMKYIKKPDDPRFGYSIDSTYGTEIYDSNPFVDGGVVKGTRSIGIVSTNTTGITNATYTATVGTTTGVSTSGSGSGATFSITVSGGAVTAVEVTAVGTGFEVGDTITITSALLTGASTSVILTLRVEDMYATTTQGSTDFTLHKSNETNLILSILGYAGLIIKDPNIVTAVTQLASADAQTKRQQ